MKGVINMDKIVKVPSFNQNLLTYEPIFPRNEVYMRWFNKLVLWEGDENATWVESSRAYFEGTYIHAGISNNSAIFTGPDAQQLLSDASINNVWKWKTGRCKHLVQLDQNGLIMNHGLFVRDAEDSFRATACDVTPMIMLMQQRKYEVQMTQVNQFVFQFSGPRSLTVIERVTNTNLHDVKFLEVRPVTIPGIDAKFEVCRIGMSGTLAYELRGDADWGPTVYKLAYEKGQQDGLKRLGARDYHVNHTFGGYPQMACSFMQSYSYEPWYAEMCMKMFTFQPRNNGSVDPADNRARCRSAVEVGWEWMADFGHDFVGKEALQAEMQNPKRKIVTLEWNKEDIIDIYASQFTDDPYKYMEMPSGVNEFAGDHQNYVCDAEGNVIGISAVPVYSSWYHTTVSETILDVDRIQEGAEVFVQWGDFGKKIKNVRAVVTRYPYIDTVDNKDYDLSTVPCGAEDN